MKPRVPRPASSFPSACDEKRDVGAPSKIIKNEKSRRFTGFKTTTKVNDEWQPPKEIDVFQLIMENFGSTDLNLPDIMKLFKNNDTLCKDWFQKHCGTFRINRSETMIFVCVKDIKPCHEYWSSLPEQQCQGKCDHFHVCKQFLFGVTHSAISCKQDHDFTTSQHNRNLLEKFSLQPLSTKQMTRLLVNAMPSVCTSYMTGKCNKTICEDIHICGDFVNNQCVKLKGLCRFQHEQALSDTNAQNVMNSFHIPDSMTLKRSLVYFKKEETKKNQFVSQRKFSFCKICLLEFSGRIINIVNTLLKRCLRKNDVYCF